MEPSGLIANISEKLNERFPGELSGSEISYDYPVFILKKGRIREVIQFLKEDPEHGYNYLTTLFAVHYPHDKGRELGVVYQLHNLRKNLRIRLKIFMPITDPVVDSLTPVFSAANWMEREAYDFFGLEFNGHPKLKRILNVEDMNYFPLRKEYALEDATREDKDDSMFGR